jgi:ferrous-iron efflux pump FieF
MNLSVIAALGLSLATAWPYFDPLFAGVIALVLLRGAYGIVHESFDILMDRELPHEDRERIIAIVGAHPSVVSVHDLRTRSTGERVFIEFHIELDGDMTLNRAHDITEDIERLIYEAFPKAEVLMHQEPAGIEDHRLDNQIGDAEKPGDKTVVG